MDEDEYWLSTFLNLEPEEHAPFQPGHSRRRLPEDEVSYDARPISPGVNPSTTQTDGNSNVGPANPASVPYSGAHEELFDTPDSVNTIRKTKAGKISDELWEQHFQQIAKLFSSNKLEELVRVLPHECNGFNPSRKQLKTRVTRWQNEGRLPVKNIRKADMDTMVLVAHLRQKLLGVQTLFTYHGFTVPTDKLEQHQVRFGVQHREINLQEFTPHITWTTQGSPQAEAEPAIVPEPILDIACVSTSRTPCAQARLPHGRASSQPESAIVPADTNTSLKSPGPAAMDTTSGNVSDSHKRGFSESIEAKDTSKRHTSADGNRLQVCTMKEVSSSQLPTHKSPPKYSYLLQEPEARLVTSEQLASEIKSIYAGLTMVENKCIQVDRALAARSPDTDQSPSQEHWQALIALHRTLLDEHHDFFLASQHPSASPAIRRLASKYSMPARMWKHGIHSFLELLRRQLPGSMDYMLAFIYLAYRLLALLCETVPAFEPTWTECLGDLARYRMAIEDEDIRDREIWACTARCWYQKAVDMKPDEGRLYHHLAILSRPNYLQQLSYYCQALTGSHRYLAARESIQTLFQPNSLVQLSRHGILVESLIKVHALSFSHDYQDSGALMQQYLASLSTEFSSSNPVHGGNLQECGGQIAMANITSLFDYGASNALDYSFRLANHLTHLPSSEDAKDCELPDSLKDPVFSSLSDIDSHMLQCDLFSKTLVTMTEQRDNPSVLPYLHITMVFIQALTEARRRSSLRFGTAVFDPVFATDVVPWEALCECLNALISSRQDQSNLSETGFTSEGSRPLPEDYMIRGQIWAQEYFPNDWFCERDDLEERYLELASTVKIRMDRILMLANKLADNTTHDQSPISRHATLRYDRFRRKFTPEPPTIYFPVEIETMAIAPPISPPKPNGVLSDFDKTMYERRLNSVSKSASTPRSYSTSQVGSTGSTPATSVTPPSDAEGDGCCD